MKAAAAFVAVVILTAHAAAQAPEALTVIGHKCKGGHLAQIVIKIEPGVEPGIYGINVGPSVCAIST